MSYSKFLKRAAAISMALTFTNVNPIFAASVGTIIGDTVNIRSDNSTDSTVISTAENGDAITIIAAEDGWFKITSPVSDEAYITSEYVQVTKADGMVIDNTVNIRTAPSLEAEIIGTADNGDTLTVIGTEGEWYAIDYYGTTAYIYADYVQGALLPYLNGTTAVAANAQKTDNVYAVVISSDLNLRSAATTESNVIKRLPEGYSLNVLGYENGWIKVSDDTGKSGFVKSDYVDLKNGTKPSNTVATTKTTTKAAISKPANPGNATGSAIVSYAEQFIGTPYVYGGTDLESGVDCSGFTYAVYQSFGIDINRVSRDQIANGEAVDKSDLQPGDLVFFNTGGDSDISHVGIYIGDGEYIHSTDAQNYIGVTISSLSSDYSESTYVGACRVID